MIKKNIQNISLSIRAISDTANKIPGCIRADIGQPNFAPPAQLEELVHKYSTDSRSIRYASTYGVPELISSLQRFEQRKAALYKQPQFFVTAGGQAALYAIMSSILSPGDIIAVDTAYYPPYKLIATILGATLREVDFSDTQSVQKHLDEDIALIILNSPSNPTGQVLSRESIECIAQQAAQFQTPVLSDDVYDRIVFDDVLVPHIAEYIPDLTLVIGSVSKLFCLPGYRVGWILGEKKLIDHIAKVHRAMNSCPNSLAQLVSAEIIQDHQYIQNISNTLKQRAKKLYEICLSLGWDVAPAQGGMYLFPQISDMNQLSSFEFAMQLLEEKHIAVVPGSAFGSQNDDRIRLCFGSMDLEDIEKITHVFL
jgi:aspartate/methionine/tyrosine aminotransferase